VAARSAGNVGDPAATLSERIEWLEGAKNFYAEAYGFSDAGTAAANTTAINAAIDAAAAAGGPAAVWLSAGRFSVNPFSVDSEVTLRGAGMPRHDRAGGLLEGGTILSNTGGTGSAVVTLNLRAGVMDLGVQTSAAKDTISGSGGTLVLNVAVRGNGTNHGFVSNAGEHIRVNNFYAAKFDHGLVLKASYNIATNLIFWDCLISSVTLASDNTQDCAHNVISNFLCESTDIGDGGGVRIYTGATDFSVYGNTVSNFMMDSVGLGVFMSGRNDLGRYCQNNQIGPGYIKTPSNNGIWISAGDDTYPHGADYNNIVGVTVDSPVQFGFLNQYGGDHNTLSGCVVRSAGADGIFGPWAKYDVVIDGVPLTGVILLLGKNANLSVPTGTGSLTDVVWETEPIDGLAMHAASSALLENPPVGAINYRIRAHISWAANATGRRRIVLQRNISGGAFAIMRGTEDSPGNSADEFQQTLEWIGLWNASYDFKISAQQTSGGALNITDSSHLTVELIG
jgi:hypothetical protein